MIRGLTCSAHAVPPSFSFCCETQPHFMHQVSCILNTLQALRGHFDPLKFLLTTCNDWGKPQGFYMGFLSKQRTTGSFPNYEVLSIIKIWNFPLSICSSHLTVLVLNTGQLKIKIILWPVFSMLMLSWHNKILTDRVIQCFHLTTIPGYFIWSSGQD